VILGSRPRRRQVVELVERTIDVDLGDRPRPDPGDHRDRGNFLSLRLYPTAPFEPWQPVASYAQPSLHLSKEPDAEVYA
jgi:hypothetical protein